jgi:hypothetical protein
MEITRTTIGLTSFNTARKIKRLKGVGDGFFMPQFTPSFLFSCLLLRIVDALEVRSVTIFPSRKVRTTQKGNCQSGPFSQQMSQ